MLNQSYEAQWSAWHEVWEEAAWHFTYVDEDETDKNTLQAGLVAVFFFHNTGPHGSRKSMSEILLQFQEKFGEHLKWGYFGSRVVEKKYTAEIFLKCVNYIAHADEDEAVELEWSSGYGFDFVGEYQIDSFSPAKWFSNIHGATSYLKIDLPVNLIKNQIDREILIEWLKECAQRLRAISGYAGLGFQQCHEYHRYENLEFENALLFNGLDVGAPHSYSWAKSGIKSINWLTFVGSHLLEKLGGLPSLEARTHKINQRLELQIQLQHIPEADPLALHAYEGGVMVQAGEWPQLGWVERDPFPPAYVAANHLLRPVRVPELKGLHMGSIVGEIRFDEKTSNEWLRRFDAAEGQVLGLGFSSEEEPSPAPSINCASESICPKTGLWMPSVPAGHPEEKLLHDFAWLVLVEEGESMPSFGLRGDLEKDVRWLWTKPKA